MAGKKSESFVLLVRITGVKDQSCTVTGLNPDGTAVKTLEVYKKVPTEDILKYGIRLHSFMMRYCDDTVRYRIPGVQGWREYGKKDQLHFAHFLFAVRYHEILSKDETLQF